MMWVALTIMTMQKAFLASPGDCRQHPLLMVWVAAPTVAMMAYLQLMYGGAPTFDFFAKTLYFIAVSSLCIVGWGFIRGYLGSCCFALTEHAYVFPLVALALATLQYHAYERGSFTQAMALGSVALAMAVILIVSMHTLMALAKGGVFRDPRCQTPLLAVTLYDEALANYLRRWAGCKGSQFRVWGYSEG